MIKGIVNNIFTLSINTNKTNWKIHKTVYQFDNITHLNQIKVVLNIGTNGQNWFNS